MVCDDVSGHKRSALSGPDAWSPGLSTFFPALFPSSPTLLGWLGARLGCRSSYPRRIAYAYALHCASRTQPASSVISSRTPPSQGSTRGSGEKSPRSCSSAMAWWDSRRESRQAPASLLSASLDDGLLAVDLPTPRLRKRFTAGDAFPRLDSINAAPTRRHSTLDMDEKVLLSPVAEENTESSSTPALVIQVEIFFTDPVIRSRYSRSYGSSPTFNASNRICRGLVRRIERCSEELITRKDSSALSAFKDEGHEPKPPRFEMTFQIMRRGKGEWAERTYRSYQKQPLTIGLTKEIISAAHRIVGLYLRRHDPDFRWIDHPSSDLETEENQITDPSREGPLSLLCIPNARFMESTQTFEFVPGYKIELTFQSRNPQRRVPAVRKSITLNSTQDAPLTLFMSEDLLWKGVQAINTALDAKKREFDDHLSQVQDGQHSCHGALEIDFRISNNLGPSYDHIHRDIKSSLVLFFDPEARDCTSFLDKIEEFLIKSRDETDAKVSNMDDLDLRIRELKGSNWRLKDPARFKIGPASSYGRRTIQAALDRIQTGVGDVIRGHNISIHLDVHKRGHLILDKAIVAHEKRGMPKENYASPSEEEAAFLSRLKARIQLDIDKVFEDSCVIDDIPEIDEEEVFVRPSTPARPSTPLPLLLPAKSSTSGRSAVSMQPRTPRQSPSPVRFERAPSDISVTEQHSPEIFPPSPALSNASPTKHAKTISIHVQPPPQPSPSKRPLVKRIFSLTRRSSESVKVVDHLKPKLGDDPFVGKSSTQPSTPASSAASERSSKAAAAENSTVEDRVPATGASEPKPSKRSFSLFRRRSRVDDVSALARGIEKIKRSGRNRPVSLEASKARPLEVLPESLGVRPQASDIDLGVMMTSSEVEESTATHPAGSVPAVEALLLSSQNDDRNQETSRSAAREPRKAKMDTPDAFEDAREFAISPAIEELVKSETSSSFFTGDVSPRFDEYSTAPSTPDLSLGSRDSSPRHSLSFTPVYVRTHSGTNDAVLRDYNPEFESEVPVVEVESDIAESQGDLPTPLATEEYPSKQPTVGDIGNLEPSVRDGRVEDQRVAQPGQTPGPEFIMSKSVEPQPTTSNPTPLTTKAPNGSSNHNSFESKTNSSKTAEKDFCPQPLGAEKNAGSDGSFPRRPDFPTKQVRDPAPTPNDDPVAPSTVSSDLDTTKPLNQNVEQAAGDQVGSAAGAEGQPVGHKDRSNVTKAGPDGHPGQADGPNPGAENKASQNTGNTKAPSTVTGSENKETVETNGPVAAAEESQTSSIPEVVGSVKPAEGSNIEFEFPEGDVRDSLQEHYGAQVQAERAAKRFGSNIEFEFPDSSVREHLEERCGSGVEAEKIRKGSESNIDFDHPESTIDEYLSRGRGFRAKFAAVHHGFNNDGSVAAAGTGSEKIDEKTAKSSEPALETASTSIKTPDFPEEVAVKSSEPAVLPTGADIRQPEPARLFADVEVKTPHHFVPEKRVRASETAIPEKRVRLSETGVVGDVLAAEPASLPTERGDVEAEKSTAVPTETQNAVVDTVAEEQQQLAAELEVQVNGDIEDVSPVAAEKIVDAERVEEPIVPEGGKALAEELEVQASPEKSGEVKRTETTETATNAQDIQLPTSKHHTDLGRKGQPAPEHPGGEQQRPPVVPPSISVKDFDITAVPEPHPHHHEEHHPAITPAIPNSSLQPNPHRISTSTFATSCSSGYTYSDSASFTTRGSVDTFRPSFDEPSTPFSELQLPHLDSPHDYEHTHPTSRPQTAGYLGLGTLRTESRFIELGLRGALGHHSKRLSLPLNQHCFFDHPIPHHPSPCPEHPGAVEAETKSETASIATSTRSKNKPRRHRRAKSEMIFSEHKDEEEGKGRHQGIGIKDGPDAAAIPKMMMLFAGAVAIGKLFKGGALS
ncbi:hypothetical protein B0T21DRAFT_389077 [Apiosordaria backusii]|uniref:Pt repeat family protein n=1 Tax=Apiosordaria backusii TaxID=314023 RepID=A0AA40EZ02_9PEZI|nr:hypothetical protein B0T21DRAFT_389077 [Apiosordaria backusii]